MLYFPPNNGGIPVYKLLFLFPTCLFLLIGCKESTFSDNPKSANNKTLIRLVICDSNNTNCFVSARFQDLKACEYSRKISSMYCDSMSVKGKMTCEDADKETVLQTLSYCLE